MMPRSTAENKGDEWIDGLSFTDPNIHDCPFETYDRLREERPVFEDPVTGHFVLTRYQDVRRVLTNFRTFSNDVGLLGIRECPEKEQVDRIYEDHGWPVREQMAATDPPAHRAKRSLVDRAFARWTVAKVEPDIEALADRLIDNFIDAGEVEFVSAFAAPLTISVMSQQLGVDLSGRDLAEYAAQVQRWTDLIVELIEPVLSPERHIEITHEAVKLQHFFAANVERVRKNPDASLLSKLIDAFQHDSEPDMPEILEIMKTILIGGNETTRFAIASAMRLLVEDEALAERLATDHEALPKFVEEALRIFAPSQTLFRRTTEDVEIAGVRILKGARVEVRFGAANRDPSVFPCPAQVDLERPNSTAHLTFGAGIHSCVGMLLARTEITIALRQILKRMKNIRRADTAGPYDISPIYLSYGLTRLDLKFEKADAHGSA